MRAAKAHYRAGAAHYQSGNYIEAIREFELSHRLSHRPEILFNLAQCHDKLGEHEKVVEYLKGYLEDLPQAADRGQVTAWLRNLEKMLAEKRAAVERAEAEKHAAERQAAAEKAAAERAMRDAAVQAALRRSPSTRRSTAGWVVPLTSAGVALALFSVGGAYGGMAMSKNDDSRKNCQAGNVCNATGLKQRSDAITAANYATGFLVGGGVALVAAGTFWFLLRPRPEPRARVVAGAGPGGAALLLQGVW